VSNQKCFQGNGDFIAKVWIKGCYQFIAV